jgi:tetratricopeptide (TPR) repeat protein
LGLAALAAGGEADEETADLLLDAASSAVQQVARSAAVLPVLAALRPLGEKAPHRYIVALAAASELETLDPEIVWYIYVALQQLKDRLLETERRWPLVEAVRAYSNLLIKHLMYIRDLWKKAVVNMCWLYDGVRKRDGTTAPESGLSAQRLFDTIAKVYVLAAALHSNELAQHVQKYCGLGDLVREAEAVRNVLDEAAAHLDELRKIMENDADFAEWTATYSPTGDVRFVIEDLRNWFTYQLASYKLNHALNEKGELDEKKLEEAAKDFEKAAEIDRKPGPWENYLTARGWALRARVFAAKSWEEFLKMAEGHQEPKTAKSFQKLWEEAREHIEPTAGYLETAADILGYYLVYLAASGNKEEAVKLLKERRWLLDYRPEVSVVTRLMLRVLGVGEGTRLKDVVNVFGPWLSPEFLPALWILAGRTQKDEALEICEQLPKPEVCVDTVAAAAGNQEAVKRLKSKIERMMPEASLLLDKVDGRTLVEVLASEYSQVHLAFMLLAAVEGRGDAVRLHGLLGSAKFKEPLPQRLFRAVYESCSDLNSERCRMALLKLYYYHL